MSAPSSSLVEVTRQGGLGVVTLNRPPVNALSSTLLRELGGALERLGSDPAIQVVIIGSALPNIFSAGADLRELSGAKPEEYHQFVARGQGLCNQVESLPQPVIAAVGGAAMGGGCELAMACDIRVAGRSARFAQPEVNLGLVAGWGGTQRLPRLVGRTVGLELLLTGEPVSAERALALGLVNRVVPDGEVMAEAGKMAQVLLAKPPRTLAWIKQAVRQGMEQPLGEGLETESGLFLQSRRSQDAQEGIQAFLGKRQPRFLGR